MNSESNTPVAAPAVTAPSNPGPTPVAPIVNPAPSTPTASAPTATPGAKPRKSFGGKKHKQPAQNPVAKV